MNQTINTPAQLRYSWALNSSFGKSRTIAKVITKSAGKQRERLSSVESGYSRCSLVDCASHLPYGVLSNSKCKHPNGRAVVCRGLDTTLNDLRAPFPTSLGCYGV
jgi:hypothetical protein